MIIFKCLFCPLNNSTVFMVGGLLLTIGIDEGRVFIERSARSYQ